MAAVGIAIVGLCGCKKAPSTTGAPATPGEQIEQHLNNAGQEIKSAATEAASQIKPALQEFREESREAVHNAAEKVGQLTETRPATMPGTTGR